LGMNVSPLMDRITGNVAKSQIGFINFMVMPLYEIWVEEFEDFKECYQQMGSNLEYWKNELEKQTNGGESKNEKKEEDSKADSPKSDGEEKTGKTLQILEKVAKEKSSEDLKKKFGSQTPEEEGVSLKRTASNASDTVESTKTVAQGIGLLSKDKIDK